MTELCLLCQLPLATERKTRGARVDWMFCGARFSAHYELHCKRVAVDRLCRELAEVESYRRGLEQHRLIENLPLPPGIVEQLEQDKVELERLRRDLANALSIANSRTYCLDSPEVLKTRVGELEKELAEAKGGSGHVFESGTSEAMRDARLRRDIFNCVEQHPTEPKIATWYYGRALQLISDYRAELAEARAIGELERRIVEAAVVSRKRQLASPDFADSAATDAYYSECSELCIVTESRVDALLLARAATGEPKEADRG